MKRKLGFCGWQVDIVVIRLSGAPSSQCVGGFVRARNKKIIADLRVCKLSAVPPTTPHDWKKITIRYSFKFYHLTGSAMQLVPNA
ncbi:hypothetical protein PoB_006656900 [Plakobranchus ocellatus]|uniref:Uncharacterized protein n=1 Tax=Plakobranchus ocellatus TaxID=259542 RepID=A0AAV4D7D8_9GAST|nr:hypothetical protein PoB_006656900 [Plakobranchus ocellatus]